LSCLLCRRERKLKKKKEKRSFSLLLIRAEKEGRKRGLGEEGKRLRDCGASWCEEKKNKERGERRGASPSNLIFVAGRGIGGKRGSPAFLAFSPVMKSRSPLWPEQKKESKSKREWRGTVPPPPLLPQKTEEGEKRGLALVAPPGGDGGDSAGGVFLRRPGAKEKRCTFLPCQGKKK